MKKRRIVIASVLKPVDDTRLSEKLAATLVAAGHDVWLLGRSAGKPPADGIHRWALPPFERLSFGRWWARWQILRKCVEVKPELLIVSTHELLIVGIANRILFGTRLVYDIQENYYRNIIWTTAFPRLLRWPLAGWVRLKEKLTAPFFHRFLLAEEGYQQELTFTRGRAVVLPNKCVLPPGFQRAPDSKKPILLFSGTLARSTGVMQAIALAQRLHAADAAVELRLVGHCASPREWDEIETAIGDASFISVTGGRVLVPHAQVLEAIRTAHAGIVYYPPSPHIENRIPTKLYEYLAAGLPILLQRQPVWQALANRVNGALVVDFDQIDGPALLRQLREQTFSTGDASAFTWAQEAPKLTLLIQNLLK
jgi:glycosyltransferase involved in cell wall biosynthesis